MADAVAFDPAAMREHLFGDDPAASVTIAEVDGVIAGMALWFRTFSTFLGRPGIWLEDLFVRPEHRGRGVGAALLGHLRGLTDGRVEWSVLDWNRRRSSSTSDSAHGPTTGAGSCTAGPTVTDEPGRRTRPQPTSRRQPA